MVFRSRDGGIQFGLQPLNQFLVGGEMLLQRADPFAETIGAPSILRISPEETHRPFARSHDGRLVQ